MEKHKEIKQESSIFTKVSLMLGIISILIVFLTFVLLYFMKDLSEPKAFYMLPFLFIFSLTPYVQLFAIFSGIIGLIEISKKPLLEGRRKCIIGIILGIIALIAYYSLMGLIGLLFTSPPPL